MSDFEVLILYFVYFHVYFILLLHQFRGTRDPFVLDISKGVYHCPFSKQTDSDSWHHLFEATAPKKKRKSLPIKKGAKVT